MAKQTFEVVWTKRITIDTDEFEDWDTLESDERNEVLGEIAHDQFSTTGPDEEEIYGVTPA